MDVDIVSSWPLNKLYEYMAFYHTQSDEFKKSNKKPDAPISFEEIVRIMELEGVKFKNDQ